MPKSSRSLPVVVATALIVLAFTAAPALAQIACGETVAPGDKITLIADVGPCASATDPAVRVTGPGKLDLAGFRVLCDPNDPPTGILVDGKSAKIMRGGADGCVTGLDLAGGEGKHKIEDFVATNSSTDGIAIDSDKNKLKRVASTGSGQDGFDIDGNGNKIEDAEAVGSGGEGFEVDGNGNKFKRIAASSNGEDGIKLAGNDNQVKDCRLISNTEDGADIEGTGNKIQKCLATRNGEGIADDTGIEVDGDGNVVQKNLIFDNDPRGILVRVGEGNNVIKKNTALGNDDNDLEDENAACGTNTFQKNKFGTSEASGVTDAPCIE